MTDVWELAAFVESHPQDYPQRWRLAKKLYAEHEYRLALEHLMVLHNSWTPKLNVERYLAATYYRLGRYAEAEERLRKTIQQWPDEVGPCEQLAYVLQVDGELKESLKTWRRVLELQPDHATAKRAIKGLESAVESKEPKAGVPMYGGFQPDLKAENGEELAVTGTVCPQCGAQNSDEFDTCWQCGVSLGRQTPSFLNTPPIEAHGPYLLRPETMTALALVAMALFVIGAAAQGGWLIWNYLNAGDSPLVSTDDLGNRILVPARLAAGLVMLVFWPFVFKLAMKLFRVKPYPPEVLVYISGLLLGALTFLLVLLPMPFPVMAFILSLLLSMAIIVFTFKLYMSMAFAVWLTHFALVWTLGAMTFWLAESRRYGELINPLAEVPAVMAAVTGADALPAASPVRVPASITPFRQKIRWQSSGSDWLDTHASQISVTIRPDTADPGLRFQLFQGGDLRYHEDLQGQSVVELHILPGQEYELAVLGPENIIVTIVIQSLLPFEFLE